MKTFILVMVLFPDAQKKAQADLDNLLRGTQLVDFGNKTSLPYTVALYNEVMQWHPFGPMGAPHAVAEYDVVPGYFIPKGPLWLAILGIVCLIQHLLCLLICIEFFSTTIN